MDDNTLRAPGSAYEDEEPVAIAVVSTGLVVDWVGNGYPSSTLWLPEPLFDELARRTSLGRLDKYAQSRLDRPQCARLKSELERVLEQPLPDALREAVLRVLTRVREVADSADLELLVEGP